MFHSNVSISYIITLMSVLLSVCFKHGSVLFESVTVVTPWSLREAGSHSAHQEIPQLLMKLSSSLSYSQEYNTRSCPVPVESDGHHISSSI
jgi:hypothetical protein